MQAKRCDRCGEFYMPYGKSDEFNAIEILNIDTFLNTRNSQYNGNHYCELCKECRDGLIKFLDSGKLVKQSWCIVEELT